MHRSRLACAVVDCDDIESGVRFWTQALGAEVKEVRHPYTWLTAPMEGLDFLLQDVPERKSAKSRVHFDVETDDLEAETARLESLGARRVEQVDRWWVMEDPCGNEFCVIPAYSAVFEEQARTWSP